MYSVCSRTNCRYCACRVSASLDTSKTDTSGICARPAWAASYNETPSIRTLSTCLCTGVPVINTLYMHVLLMMAMTWLRQIFSLFNSGPTCKTSSVHLVRFVDDGQQKGVLWHFFKLLNIGLCSGHDDDFFGQINNSFS